MNDGEKADLPMRKEKKRAYGPCFSDKMTNPSGATSSFGRSGIPQTPLALGAATTRKRVSEYLDSLPLEEEQQPVQYAHER